MKKNKIVYLCDGRKAELLQKYGEKAYSVQLFKSYSRYIYDEDMDEEEIYEALSEEKIVVEEIFAKPPRDIFDKQCEDAHDNYERVMKQTVESGKKNNQLRSEIGVLEKTKTNLEKMIINQGELRKAERITIFVEKRVMPISFSRKRGFGVPEDVFPQDKDRYGLQITMTYKIQDGIPTTWQYELVNGSSYTSSSSVVDNQYGIMVDLSDAEIDSLTKKRAASKPTEYFDSWALKNTNDEFLTESLIGVKKEYVARDNAARIKNIEESIAKQQKELSELLNKQ